MGELKAPDLRKGPIRQIEETHPDYQLLIKAISKVVDLRINHRLSTSSTSQGHGNYQRVHLRHGKYLSWTDYEKKVIEDVFTGVNTITKEYNFTLSHVCNPERDDDRMIPAYFSFYSDKK